MSLVGNLEELGLGEILQIVSLSRKTGVLSLSSRGRDGSIFFRQGQVVRATSTTYQHSLGEVLIQKGIIDLSVLRKSLALQQTEGFKERLGTILVKNFAVSQEVIEDVVREQIENVVFSLFSWLDGNFSFDVQGIVETVDGTKMDPLQFMLNQGLNPQFLAMEGSRILDESRHTAEVGGHEADSAFNENVDFDFDLVDPSSVLQPVENCTKQPVVIVDDDGPTLRAIAEALTARGFDVHAMTRSEDTLIKVDTLYRNGERPTVLIDLIMPKMDGSGVLGGVELLEMLHGNFKDIPLVVMSDYNHSDAESRIKSLGCGFFVKPRRAEIALHDVMNAFLDKFISEMLPTSVESSHYSDFNLGDELRIELGDDEDMPKASNLSTQGGGFSLLRGMLEELNNPDLQGGVMLLVLRFASEFVNRAIVFTLNDQIISGSGQFGIANGHISGDERVRAVHFHQEADSIFSEVMRSMQPAIFKPVPTSIDVHLFDQLNGGLPEEVFIGPLISNNRIIGFLYGDNLPENKPVGDVEPLVIFLSQAGIALERSLLERQLNERNNRD